VQVQLAVHYSPASAALLARGHIAFDRFKCPAWPDLVREARAVAPVYVHLPLIVGSGVGDAQDSETHAPPDWAAFERLLTGTDTPFVNLHLAAHERDYPGIPRLSADPAHTELVAGRLLRDVRGVVARWGADRVIVENVPEEPGRMRAAYLPETVRRVVAETGCGLLLDVSHARLAAPALGMDARDYIAALPVDRTREIHITGIQPFDEHWARVLRDAGVPEATIAGYAGRPLDHLPFTDADWEFAAWAIGRVHSGAWGEPWLVALEYGGVGGAWGAVTDAAVLREQVPRLAALLAAE